MNPNQPVDPSKDRIYWKYILYALGACTLLIVGFGWAVCSLAVIATELLIGFAALSVGFLIGFLFGLPRAGMQNNDEESGSKTSVDKQAGEVLSKVKYRPSTNLEQISDWLTKILIGVGLVELGQIKFLLADMGRVIGAMTPGFAGNHVLPQVVLVAYSMLGFFVGYIWTRIEYTKLQIGVDASILAEIVNQGDKIKSLEQQASQTEKVTELMVSGELVSPSVDATSAATVADDSSASSADGNSEDAAANSDSESEHAQTSVKDNKVELGNGQTPDDSNDAVPNVEYYEIKDWPIMVQKRLREFINFTPNSRDPAGIIFRGYSAIGSGRRLIVRAENLIGSTAVISVSLEEDYNITKGQAWFLLHPSFGSRRIRRVRISGGKASITFSTSKAFTVVVIADDGNTVLAYDIANTPNLPLGFFKLS